MATKMTKASFEMFELFEKTPDLVCITGKDGYFRKINPAVIDKLGYPEMELLSRPVFDFLHPDDRERTGKAREKLLAGVILQNFHNRYCTSTGGIVWLEWTSIYIPEKEVVFAIAKDITTRKLIELENEERYRKFKALTAHFKSSMEKDRKMIATELHEQLGQLATAIRLDIGFLQAALPHLDGMVKDRMDRASAMIGQLIEMFRRVSFSISPNMLDEMGLDEVMKWLCREFSKQNGIGCTYSSSFDDQSMSGEIQLDVFRICQERMSRILEHGRATKVSICLEQLNEQWQLTISDNGTENQESLQNSLTSIQERVASVDGQLFFKAGTENQIRVTISLAR